MKKMKAKPVKGSARTKKFDAGGLAALAGLGALAYMMRKKKEGTGSVPTDTSGYSSSRADVSKMIEGSRDEESRTPSATKFGGESNLGSAITEGGTRPGPDTTEPKLERKSTPVAKKRPASQTFPLTKPTKTVAAKTEDKPASVGMTGIPISSGAPKPNEERPTKPYPSDEERAKVKAKAQTKTDSPKPATEKEYGIGPYKSFAGLHKAFSSRTESQADRVAAAAKKKKELASSGMNRGGSVKKYAAGGSVGSASKRADGIAQRGKTKGRIC